MDINIKRAPTSRNTSKAPQNVPQVSSRYFLLPNERLEDFTLDDVTDSLADGFVCNVQPIENFYKKKKEKTSSRKTMKQKDHRNSSDADFDANSKIQSLFESSSDRGSSNKRLKKQKEEAKSAPSKEVKLKKKSKKKEERALVGCSNSKDISQEKDKQSRLQKKNNKKGDDTEYQAKREEKNERKKREIMLEGPAHSSQNALADKPTEIETASDDEAARIRREEDALIEKYRPQIEKEQRRENKEKKKRELGILMAEENWTFYDATGYDDEYLMDAFKLDKAEVRLKMDHCLLNDYSLPREGEHDEKERERSMSSKKARRQAAMEQKECFNCKIGWDIDNDTVVARSSAYCSNECIEATVEKAKEVIDGDQTPVMIMSSGSISQGPPLSELFVYIQTRPHVTPILPARTNIEDTTKPKKIVLEFESIPDAVDKERAKMVAEIAKREAQERKEQDIKRQREFCVKNLTDCLVARMKNASMKFMTKDLKQLSRDLEIALFRANNNDIKSPRYRAWMRAYVAAVKSARNKGFFARVATKFLSIHTLVTTNPEDLGSQKFSAELVDDSALALNQKPKMTMRSMNVLDEILDEKRDRTFEHGSHLFDANCRICRSKQEKELAAVLESREQKEKAAAEMMEIKRRKDELKRFNREEDFGQKRKLDEGDYEDDFFGGGGDCGDEDLRQNSNSDARPDTSYRGSPRSPPMKKRSPNLGRIASPEPLASTRPAKTSCRSSPPLPPRRFFASERTPPSHDLKGESWTSRRHESWRDSPKQNIDYHGGRSSRSSSLISCPFSLNASKPIWKGSLSYGRLSPMNTSMVPVSNPRCFELAKHFPQELPISGRIDHYPVFEMLAGNQRTFSSAVFCIFEILPPEDKFELGVFLRMCSDMQTLHKHLVISSLLTDMDAYIIYLKPRQDYPAPLLPWHGPGIPDVRNEDKVYIIVTCRPMLEGKFPSKALQLPLLSTSTLAALPAILSKIENKPKSSQLERIKDTDSLEFEPEVTDSPKTAIEGSPTPADNFLPTNFFDLVKKSKTTEERAPKFHCIEETEITCVEDVALALQLDIPPNVILTLIKRFISLPDKCDEDIAIVKNLCMAKIARCKQLHAEKEKRQRDVALQLRVNEEGVLMNEPLSEKEQKELEKEFGLDNLEASNSTFDGVANLLDQLNQHVMKSESTETAIFINGSDACPESTSHDTGEEPSTHDPGTVTIKVESQEESASFSIETDICGLSQKEEALVQRSPKTIMLSEADVPPLPPPPPPPTSIPSCSSTSLNSTQHSCNKSENGNFDQPIEIDTCTSRKDVPSILPQLLPSSTFLIVPPPPPPELASDRSPAPPPPPPQSPCVSSLVSELSAPPDPPPIPLPPNVQVSLTNPHFDPSRVVPNEGKEVGSQNDGLMIKEEKEDSEAVIVDKKPLLPSCPQTGPRPPITFSEEPEEKQYGTSNGISFSEGEVPMHSQPLPNWTGPTMSFFPPPPMWSSSHMQGPPTVAGISHPFGMPSAMRNPNNMGHGQFPPNFHMGLPQAPYPRVPRGVPPPIIPQGGYFAPNRGVAGFGHNMSENAYYLLGMKKPIERPVTPDDSESESDSDYRSGPRNAIPGARAFLPSTRPGVAPGIRPGAVLKNSPLLNHPAMVMPGVVVPTMPDSDEERRLVNEERARREAVRSARTIGKQVPLPLPQTRANNVEPDYDFDEYDSNMCPRRKNKGGGKKRRRAVVDVNFGASDSINKSTINEIISQLQDENSDMEISEEEDIDADSQNVENIGISCSSDQPTSRNVESPIEPMLSPRQPADPPASNAEEEDKYKHATNQDMIVQSSRDESNFNDARLLAEPLSRPRILPPNLNFESVNPWNNRNPDGDRRGFYDNCPPSRNFDGNPPVRNFESPSSTRNDRYPCNNREDYRENGRSPPRDFNGPNSWSNKYPPNDRPVPPPHYYADSPRWHGSDSFSPALTPRGEYSGRGRDDWGFRAADEWRGRGSWRGCPPTRGTPRGGHLRECPPRGGPPRGGFPRGGPPRGFRGTPYRNAPRSRPF